MSPRLAAGRQAGDTKLRILDAAEDLFIEYGYEAMSLRQITSRAEVNLAAVNYHFGSKETLLQAMLARRLDRLNDERLALLTRAEAEWPDGQLTCEHVLGAMFIPALAISHHREIGSSASICNSITHRCSNGSSKHSPGRCRSFRVRNWAGAFTSHCRPCRAYSPAATRRV